MLLEPSDPAESEAIIQVTQTRIFTLLESFFELCFYHLQSQEHRLLNGESGDDSEVPNLGICKMVMRCLRTTSTGDVCFELVAVEAPVNQLCDCHTLLTATRASTHMCHTDSRGTLCVKHT